MPARKHDQHPDHMRTTGSKTPTGKPIDDAPKAHHSTQPHTLADSPANVHMALLDLLRRDDGWLRVAPDTDGKVVWWKWKITRGKWSGHYVMVRAFVDQHEEAMGVMLRRLQNVDLGYERPTRDSYYDQA